MTEETYEQIAARARERDGFKCTHCSKEHWVERNGERHSMLRVQRKNLAKPDTMWNLETVCRTHYTEMD